MYVRSDVIPWNVGAYQSCSRQAYMAHTARRSWHVFKPKPSGLSEHQPAGRYTQKVLVSPGTHWCAEGAPLEAFASTM